MNTPRHLTDAEHDEIRSLLAPYALDALDDSERLMVAEHVDTCASCTAEVTELLDTAAIVALSESEVAPPTLWSGIQTGMRAAQTPPAPVKVPETAPQVNPTPTPVTPSNVVSLDKKRLQRRWLPAVAAAAAAVMIAVPMTARLSTRTTDLRQLAAQDAKASGSRTIDLVSVSDTKTKFGDVVVTADGSGYVRLSNTPALPADQTYQLWAVVDGVPISAGLLGNKPTVAAFTARSNVQAIALSIEAAKGATAPTVGPIAVAAVQT
jgi:anti-sigma factor RsiW